MKKNLILFLVISFSFCLQAQNKVDSLRIKNYLEDQFHVGIAYSLLTNKPANINLRGFSNAFLIGYLRDIPFNKKRNTGIGIGLSYTFSTYFHNMKIVDLDGKTYFSDFEDIDDFSANKLTFHSIDLPFEFRLRNSTYKRDKYWRLYLGMKVSYIFSHKSQFILDQDNRKSYRNFDHFNTFQYGLTASAGVGTWNGYVYYGLTNLFDNALYNDVDVLDVKSIRVGLIFYIL